MPKHVKRIVRLESEWVILIGVETEIIKAYCELDDGKIAILDGWIDADNEFHFTCI